MRIVTALIVLAFLLGAAVVPAIAQEGTEAQAQAEQDAWMKAAQVGIHHAHLKALAGSWEYTSKMWESPSAPPTESKGTCERSMILGDRYLYEDYKGDFMGMPFNGIGITGYDNINEQYQSAWMDNMSTAIMTGSGTCSDDGKKLTMKMFYTDPMTKKTGTMRMVSTLTDPTTQLSEYYGEGPDGTEFKMMEFTMTRK
jgi:hypothetical protein